MRQHSGTGAWSEQPIYPAGGRRRIRWSAIAGASLGAAATLVAVALLSHHTPPARTLGVRSAACRQPVPAGAGPAARAYLAAANAGDAGWARVTADIRAHHGPVLADYRDQALTDIGFVDRLRQISFPPPAAQDADALESAVGLYVRLLAAVVANPATAVRTEPTLRTLDAERADASILLRGALRLPASSCLVLRP